MKTLTTLALSTGVITLSALIVASTSVQGQMMTRYEPTKATTQSSATFTATPKKTSMMNNSAMMMEPASMQTNPKMDNSMMDDDMSMTMSDHGTYSTYSPAKVRKALRANQQVVLVFASSDSNGSILDASLQDHQMWLPKDTVVLSVSYDTNRVVKRKYNVTTPNTILVITQQGRSQKITARVTTPVSTINDFLDWMESYNMMGSEQVTLVGGAEMFSTKDIVSNVVNAPNLTTLVAAVKAAGLVATLQSDGPFTVFGPDNAAFAKLPSETVEMLVQAENKALLTKILTYHVVAGTYTSADLKDGMMLTTVQGQKLTVKKQNNTIMLMSDTDGNVATVVTADVFQKNGVAHVIDTVLMPQ